MPAVKRTAKETRSDEIRESQYNTTEWVLKPAESAGLAGCAGPGRHGGNAWKRSEFLNEKGHRLAGEGITVLRFDFTGLGESEGEFSDTNFSSNVDDLVAAARYLAEEYQSPKILIGHSLGGAAVLQSASRIPSAVAVATIATWASRYVGATEESQRRETRVTKTAWNVG